MPDPDPFKAWQEQQLAKTRQIITLVDPTTKEQYSLNFREWQTRAQLVLEDHFLLVQGLLHDYSLRCNDRDGNNHPFCILDRRVLILLKNVSQKGDAYQAPTFHSLEMGDEKSPLTPITKKDEETYEMVRNSITTFEDEWKAIIKQLPDLQQKSESLTTQTPTNTAIARERAAVEEANRRAGVSTPTAVTSEAGRVAHMRTQAEAEDIAAAVRREGVSMTAADHGGAEGGSVTERRTTSQVSYEVISTRDRPRPIEDIISEDAASYEAKGLARWATEVRTLAERWNQLTVEEHNYIEQKRREGWLVIGMPSAQTQLDTMQEAVNVFRPLYGQDRTMANLTHFYWDHPQNLINSKNRSLIATIPDHPYFFLFLPSDRPPEDSCRKTVKQQKQWVGIQHKADVHIFAEQFGEYIASQTRLTEKGGEPVDAATFTRLIELPLRDGCVVYAYWGPYYRRLWVDRGDAGGPNADGGVRLVGRV